MLSLYQEGLYAEQVKDSDEATQNAYYDAELTSDLIGEYIFSDADFVRNLSAKNRNLFQKVYDEIKYFLKQVNAGSEAERQLLKAKKIFEDVYRESTPRTTDTTTRFSISDDGKMVDNKGDEVTLETSEAGTHNSLLAIHNLTSEKLKGILELDGFPVPSIAIIDTNKEVHTNFGDISVLFDKETILLIRKMKFMEVMFTQNDSHKLYKQLMKKHLKN